MAVAFVKNHAVAFNKTAGTTLALALDTDVPAGNLIVCRMVYDNFTTASKPLVSSIGRAAGETATWVQAGYALSTSTSAGAFAQGAMHTIRTTVVWPAGSYTVTLDSSVTMKAGAFQEFSGVTNFARVVAASNYSTTTTAATATTTSATPVIGDLALGFIFQSNSPTVPAGDNDTTGGAWSAATSVGSTGSSANSNNHGGAQYKILTGASHQTLNNSAVLTAGNGCIVTVLQAASEPTITQAAYRIYDDGTETGAVALAAQDTAANGDITSGDGIGQLRVRLQSTAEYPVATDDYQLQWEKNASGSWFNVGTPTLVDSLQSQNTQVALGNGTITKQGQSVLGNGQNLVRASFYLQKTGAPSFNLTAELYAHTGTYGSGGVATGSPLATSTTVISATTLTASFGWFDFDFDGTFRLANGTPYVIAVSTSTAGDGSNWVLPGGNNTPSSHGGNGTSFAGSWSGDTLDRLFRIYTGNTVALPYASASTTDGGATTNRLGAGTGSFVAGKTSEDGLVDNVGWTANNFTELLYSVKIVKTDVVAGDVIRFRVLRNGVTTGMTYTQTPTLNVVELAVIQAAYRFYADGTETGSTALAAQNETPTVDLSSGTVNIQLRTRLQLTTAATAPATDDWALQYELNTSGTWNTINPITVPISGVGSANLTDNAPTASRLTGGTGTFVAGKVSTTGTAVDVGWSGNNHTELLYSLAIQTPLSNGDTLRFRVLRNGVTTGVTYTQYPTLNVTKTAIEITQAAYRIYDDGTETGATPLAAQDTPADGDITSGDGIGQLRVRLQSTTSASIPAADDFQLQWEKNASGIWTNVVARTITGYDSSNVSTYSNLTGSGPDSVTQVAQSFTGDGKPLTRVGFWLSKTGAGAGTAVAVIYAHSGTFGTSSVPTGAALATSTTVLTASTLSTTPAWVYFDFDGSFTPTNGTSYCLAIVGTAQSGINPVNVGIDNTSPTAPGNYSYYMNGTWSAESGGTDTAYVMYTGFDVLTDSYSEANKSTFYAFGYTGGPTRSGQSFLGNGGKLTQARFYLAKVGAPSGLIGAELYAHTGTFGTTSGAGTGSALAVSLTTVESSTLAADPAFAWIAFDFDGSYTLAAGTPYVLVLTASGLGADAINAVRGGLDLTASTHPGRQITYISPSWGAGSDADQMFQIYTASSVVPYNSANLTDAAATTNRLGAGSGSFVAGEISETGLVTDLGWSGNNYTELLFPVAIKKPDVVAGDVIRFRILRNGTTTGMTYTAVPTVNVVQGVQNIAATISTNWGSWTASAVGDVHAILVPATISTNWSPPVEVLADSYSETNSNITHPVSNDSGLTGVGQSFLGNGQRLSKVGWWIINNGTGVNVTARLYAHTGTFGIGTATGPALAVSDTRGISFTLHWEYFTFDGSFTLANGTPYVITAEGPGTIGSSCSVGTDTTSPAHAGCASVKNPGWSALSTVDRCFEVYTLGAGDGWTATATGTVETPSATDHPGTITTSWGVWTAAATAQHEAYAGISTSWDAWASSAAATVLHPATSVQSWGVWVASADGTVIAEVIPATITTSWGLWVASATGTVTGPAPAWSIPPNVVATSTGQTTITVTWDAVPAASGYDVERNGTVIVYDHPASPYNDSGLASDTQYDYRVRAVG